MVLVVAAGFDTTSSLISNANLRMVGDDRYYSSLSNGALSTYDAVMKTLRHREPAMSKAKNGIFL